MSPVNPSPTRHPQGHDNLYPHRDLTPEQQAQHARKDRKIYRVNPDQLGVPREYGWTCRTCSGKPYQRGFTTSDEAADHFDAEHVPTAEHQDALRVRAVIDGVCRAIEGAH